MQHHASLFAAAVLVIGAATADARTGTNAVSLKAPPPAASSSAPRIALAMQRDGPDVDGNQWDAQLSQVRGWERATRPVGEAPVAVLDR